MNGPKARPLGLLRQKKKKKKRNTAQRGLPVRFRHFVESFASLSDLPTARKKTAYKLRARGRRALPMSELLANLVGRDDG